MEKVAHPSSPLSSSSDVVYRSLLQTDCFPFAYASTSAQRGVNMDRITKGIVDEFRESQSLQKLPDDKAFERLCNHCIVSREIEEFNVEDVSTGGGGDGGIDGLAIIVNNAIITTIDEIEDAAARSKYLDVTFIFVQAKTSDRFSASDVGTFAFGVKDFFSETPKLIHNDFITRAHKVQMAVFGRGSLFSRGKPHCKLFYVTTGKWLNDANVSARLQQGKADLEQLQLFKTVEVSALGADELHGLYQRTKHHFSVEFTFQNRVVLPEIADVSQAHIGVLPAKEFLRLIVDEGGALRRSLFYDNVRDYQGNTNIVNEQIALTLDSKSERGRFHVLNNGVTVVSKSLRNIGGHKFVIEDYQIVNGCQTSHVVYAMCAGNELAADAVHVPVKIIETTNDSITTAIIKATNSQTEVRREQLEALSGFQKKLEAFFETFKGDQRLFYERRLGQYGADSSVRKVRVITMLQLVKAFGSMFLDEPHRVTRSPSAVIDKLGKDIFSPDHHPLPYYVSAFAHYKIESLFRNQVLEPRYKSARYHILMAVRHMAAKVEMPYLNSKKMESYCGPILNVLWDEESAVDTFVKAARKVDRLSGGDLDNDELRTQPFVVKLLDRLGT
ncbi:AIPR family protein [Pendulispora brunnea]|uniref:AIPR family protein n=1 Tax=Pendulispora brunnea TaxID=2905690 RepID=A0ABZ2KFD0_9BACT